MERERLPWWLWPNLLSLDAPLVALAWGWMFTKAWGLVSLPWELWLTLALAVWAIYASDRLFDSRRALTGGGGNSNPELNSPGLATRHRFHWKFRHFFIPAIIAAVVYCIYASLNILAREILLNGYGVFVLSFAGLYFLFTFLRPRNGQDHFFKNVLASLTFAYGTSAGIHAYSPVLPLGDMVFSSEVLLFAGLCLLNMTAIDFWHLKGEDDEDASAVLNLATLIIAGIAMFIFVSTMKRESFFFNEAFYHEQAFYKAFSVGVLVGSASFFLLNNARHQFTAQAYRVLVDLAIVSPVFVFWVMISLDGDART